MKKIVTVIAFVCAAAAAYAQKTDSLTVIKPEKVIIQSSDSSQVVTVVGKEGNPSYRFTSKLNVADGVSNRVVTEHRGLDFSIFNQALTEKTRETEWCLMGFSELGLGWHAAINGPAEIQKSSRWISEFTWRNALALRYEPIEKHAQRDGRVDVASADAADGIGHGNNGQTKGDGCANHCRSAGNYTCVASQAHGCTAAEKCQYKRTNQFC